MVPSKTSTFDPIVPKRCGVFSPDENILERNKEKEFQWLSKVSAQLKETPDEYNDLSWAAHHASIQPQQSFIPSKNIALLPLFRENAHAICMMSHAMNMVKKAICHINPEQIPVIVVDQPLFAMCKQIQWTWPESHGED